VKETIAPFAVPSQQVVDHGGWRVSGADGEHPLPADVDHWDYQTVMALSAPISVAREQALSEAGLDESSEVAILVTVRSDHTGSYRRVAMVTVPSQARYDLAVEFDLEGDDLGGRLDLNTFLVATLPIPRTELGARRPGSVLWRTRHRTNLEGDSSRFPTDSTDFSLTRPREASAGWALHIDLSDPEASFMSSVRLTLNSGLEPIQDLLRGVADARTATLRNAIRWDVTRQLAFAALASDEVRDGPPDPEATTISGVLRQILAGVWPHDEPTILRQRMISDPEAIEVHLQAQTRWLGGKP